MLWEWANARARFSAAVFLKIPTTDKIAYWYSYDKHSWQTNKTHDRESHLERIAHLGICRYGTLRMAALKWDPTEMLHGAFARMTDWNDLILELEMRDWKSWAVLECWKWDKQYHHSGRIWICYWVEVKCDIEHSVEEHKDLYCR